MLELGWSDARRALFVAWAVLAATALYQTVTVGFAPTWLVAVVWGIVAGWATTILLQLESRGGGCDYNTPVLLAPLMEGYSPGLLIQGASLVAVLAMTTHLGGCAITIVLLGWAVGQIIELPFPPTITDICDDNPNKLVVLGLVAGWAAIQFTGTVDIPVTVFYGFAIGAVTTGLSFALDVADYMGDYRLVTGCSAITLVLGGIVLIILSVCGVVAWTWSLSFSAGVVTAVGVGYGTLWWEDMREEATG